MPTGATNSRPTTTSSLQRAWACPRTSFASSTPAVIDEFGALTLASIDEHGALQGIELVGIKVPPNTELDRSAIRGAYGQIAPTATIRPGAPLAVGSDFGELHAKWLSGANVGWRCSDTICEFARRSIAQHGQRIGAPEIEPSPTHADRSPCGACASPSDEHPESSPTSRGRTGSRKGRVLFGDLPGAPQGIPCSKAPPARASQSTTRSSERDLALTQC